MDDHRQDRLYAACGIASVGVLLAGFAIGAAGGRELATITSTPEEITKALAKPAGTAVWAGAYVEMLSYGFFLAFAVWACKRLGGGILGGIAATAAAGYAALSMAALAVGDAIEYRAGHGVGLQLGTALITVQEALYVTTWFLSAFFLAAAGCQAVVARRPVLGWSAVGVAALTLVLTAVSLDNLGQMANFLWLVWIVGASIALARGARAHADATAARRGLREATD
jgi:hypothetical protein